MDIVEAVDNACCIVIMCSPVVIGSMNWSRKAVKMTEAMLEERSRNLLQQIAITMNGRYHLRALASVLMHV